MIKTAGELNDYLISLCEAEQPSVDRIIAGDKNTVIIKAGTCWMPYLKTLQKAYEKGVNGIWCRIVYIYSRRYKNVDTGGICARYRKSINCY